MSFLPLAYQQKRLLKKASNDAVRKYLETPLPKNSQAVNNTEFLALDFETTGFNAQKEAILSVGYTLVRKGRVVLAENGHHIIKINRPIPDKSVVVHKITDDRAEQGEHLHDVLEILLKKMAGRVLIVHFVSIERSFLNAAFQKLYGYKLPMQIVDTLEIEKKQLQRRQSLISPNQLRLFNLRTQYGLPRYNAHNALEDAIATAELFLAQVAHKSPGAKGINLRDVLV